MAKILAIESSTNWASLAILDNDIIIAEKSSGSQRTHSEFINHALHELLLETKLSVDSFDSFAVGVGPGSFTGIRVALNIIKTFSYSTHKPIYACDSLTLLQRKSGEDCLTMINAFKNMVYWAVFRSGEPVGPPLAISINSMEDHLQKSGVRQPILCLGDGYIAYERYFSSSLRQLLIRKTDQSDFPAASTLGKMAYAKDPAGKFLNWQSILPLYLRGSEAEENLKK